MATDPHAMPPTLARLLDLCEQAPSPGPDAILAAAADWREAGALRPGRLERRPIETLPEEREGDVLAYRMGSYTSGAPCLEAWILHPGIQPRPAEWWSPLPPLAMEQDVPAAPESGPTVDAVLGFLWPDDEPRDTIADEDVLLGDVRRDPDPRGPRREVEVVGLVDSDPPKAVVVSSTTGRKSRIRLSTLSRWELVRRGGAS